MLNMEINHVKCPKIGHIWGKNGGYGGVFVSGLLFPNH
jgi:hypothetical protein